MKGILQILFALRVDVVANLREVVLFQSLIIDLHQRVPLHLLHALLRRRVLLNYHRAVRRLPMVGPALFQARLL